MPLLHNPLSRLGKTESKYEFELTVQALRMADSVNPSKELVYVEISRGGKRFKTSNIVHTGDISWDDTFLFVSTLYKSDTHLAGAAAQFEPKEYMVALLEYNSMRRQGPKVLCKARLNLALFAAAGHEGKDVPVTCYLLDRAGRQSAILTLAVRSKWLADTKLDTGRGLARFKTSSGDVGLDVGADGGVRAQDSLRVPSGGGGGSGIPARTGRLSGRRSGEDEDDSASSSGSVSTAWTRSTAASSAIGGTTLIPASASGASNFRGSMGSEAASAADACADGSCSAPHAVGACGGCAVGSAGSVAGAAVQPATHAAGVSASVPGAGACAGASGAGPAGGGGSGASAAASAAACAGAATDGATGEFVPSLHRIDSTEELASLVSKSPSQRAQTAEHDALLLDHALRLRDAPPAERYTHQGLPVAALLIARYSIEVRSSRFTVAACAALRARLHAHARQPAALAYELSVLSVLLALARGHLLARTGVAAHPAGAGPSFGLGLGLEPPRDVRAGKGGGALSTSAARVLEHEQRVLANFCSEVLRLSASALELFLRPVLLDLGPRLGPALLEAALSAESAARAHTEQQRLAAALRGASDALFAANVPPPAVRALVLRVARFVGAQAFNSLALRRELCTSGNGVQIKLALAVLERWVEDVGARCAQLDVGAARTPPRARSAGAQRRAAAHASRGSSSGGGRGRECAHTSAALEALAHVRQAADIFIVDKAVLLSDEDRAQVCPALSAAQLGHMLRMCARARSSVRDRAARAAGSARPRRAHHPGAQRTPWARAHARAAGGTGAVATRPRPRRLLRRGAGSPRTSGRRPRCAKRT